MAKPTPGVDAPSDPPDAETGDTGGSDAAIDGAAGVDEAMAELEAEIDREAGEYPHAVDSMATLSEAAKAVEGEPKPEEDDAEAEADAESSTNGDGEDADDDLDVNGGDGEDGEGEE